MYSNNPSGLDKVFQMRDVNHCYDKLFRVYS